MTRENFDSAVQKGAKLVLLDNLVVDVTQFINQHPGGKFVLNHNVGRDISKFFFGGYCLEDNETPNNRGHNHSVYARMIVNELTIAIFERDIPCGTEEVVQIQNRASDVNGDTKTIFLAASTRS